MFGSPSIAFTNNCGFGTIKPQTNFSLFGQTNQASFGDQNINSFSLTSPKFEPLRGIESINKDGFTTNKEVTYQSICFYKENETKSLEEIRCQDYIDKKNKNEFKSMTNDLSVSNSNLKQEYKAKMNRIDLLKMEIKKQADLAKKPIRDKENELMNEVDKIKSNLKSIDLLQKTLENIVDVCKHNVSNVENNTNINEILSDYSNFKEKLVKFIDFTNEYELSSSQGLFGPNFYQIKIQPRISFGFNLDQLILELEHSFYKLNKSISDLLFENCQSRMNKTKVQSFNFSPFSITNDSNNNSNSSLFGQSTGFGSINQSSTNLNGQNNSLFQSQATSPFSFSSNTINSSNFKYPPNQNNSFGQSVKGTPFGKPFDLANFTFGSNSNNSKKNSDSSDQSKKKDNENLDKDDEEIFHKECKLIIFDKTSNEWKENGDGIVKIFKKDSNSYLIIVSRDLEEIYFKIFGYQISKTVLELTNDETRFKWNITDSAEAKSELMTKFETKEDAKEFQNEFEKFKNLNYST